MVMISYLKVTGFQFGDFFSPFFWLNIKKTRAIKIVTLELPQSKNLFTYIFPDILERFHKRKPD